MVPGTKNPLRARAIRLFHRVHLLGATAEDRAVPARVFGGIHSIVGKTEQFFVAVRAIGSRGDADTQRNEAERLDRKSVV